MLKKSIIKQYIKQLSNSLKKAYLSGYFRHNIFTQYTYHLAKGNSGYFG